MKRFKSFNHSRYLTILTEKNFNWDEDFEEKQKHFDRCISLTKRATNKNWWHKENSIKENVRNRNELKEVNFFPILFNYLCRMTFHWLEDGSKLNDTRIKQWFLQSMNIIT